MLVLDEPTNHLDIPSREALEEALDAYQGTILTISHDRYFLDRIATQILALNGEGVAEHYDGDYTEYHDWKAGGGIATSQPIFEQRDPGVENLVEFATATPTPGDQSKSGSGKSKPSGKESRLHRSHPQLRLSKRTKARALSPVRLEAEIAEAEKKLNEISEKMSRPEVARDATELIKLDEDYKQTESRLSVLYSRWEEAAAKS